MRRACATWARSWRSKAASAKTCGRRSKPGATSIVDGRGAMGGYQAIFIDPEDRRVARRIGSAQRRTGNRMVKGLTMRQTVERDCDCGHCSTGGVRKVRGAEAGREGGRGSQEGRRSHGPGRSEAGTAAAAQGHGRHGEGHAGHGRGDGRQDRATASPSSRSHSRRCRPRCRRSPAGTMDEPRGRADDLADAVLAGRDRVRKGDREIDMTIVDTGFAQMLIAPWSMMLGVGLQPRNQRRLREGDDRRRPPAVRKVGQATRKRRRAERLRRQALHGRRSKAATSTDIKALHEFASKMDFGKIAALK